MKQKGQGVVEFAIIVPLLVALGISIIYVGIMFLDYTQYSNAARDAARDISLQANTRQTIVDAINKESGEQTYNDTVSKYQSPFTNIYTPEWKAQFYDKNGNVLTSSTDATDIEVTITLKLKTEEVDGEISTWGGGWTILPTQLKPISYRMILE